MADGMSTRLLRSWLIPGAFVKDDRGVCFYEIVDVGPEFVNLREVASGPNRKCEYGRVYQHPLRGCSAVVLEPWLRPTRFERAESM